MSPTRVLAVLLAGVCALLGGCDPNTLTPTAPTATSPTVGAAVGPPAKALGLGGRFNLGVGRTGGHTTIKPAQLEAGYSAPEFQLTDDRRWVRFTVRADAETTPNSKYPRSELGEVGRWDGGAGSHTLTAISRVVRPPAGRPNVVIAQIHDSSSDLVRLQTEAAPGGGLRLITRNTPPGGGDERTTVVAPTYQVGQLVRWRFTVTSGRGVLYLDDRQVLTFPADDDQLWFKTGAYAQANTGSGTTVVDIAAGSLRLTHTR